MELGQVLILGSMLGKQKSALSNPYCGLQDTPISVVICPKFTRKSPMASWALPTQEIAHRTLNTHKYLNKRLIPKWKPLKTKKATHLWAMLQTLLTVTLNIYTPSLLKLCVSHKVLSLFKLILHSRTSKICRYQRTLSRRYLQHLSLSSQQIRSTSYSSTWMRPWSTLTPYRGQTFRARRRGKSSMMRLQEWWPLKMA